MMAIKRWRFLLLAGFAALLFHTTSAQTIDEKTYQHKMQLMDSLCMYKMQDFDTLYHVSISQKYYGTEYKNDYYGWIRKRDSQQIRFLNINGREYQIKRIEITGLMPLSINGATMAGFTQPAKEQFLEDIHNFGRNYLLMLWLYKQKKFDYSRGLINNDRFFADSLLRDAFGIVYYDSMLQAYSPEKDYPTAITFGEHLSHNAFKGYQYQPVAIALTQQLKNNPGDFKTFTLPDSSEWVALKQKLNRHDQILYLADRLRLLDCVQNSQPGGISYDMDQYSTRDNKADPDYKVVNPFVELLEMKLNVSEAELLLPYLLTGAYIPSYNYHRDFFPERNLHRLSWVVEELLYNITNRLFLDRLKFDELTLDEKKARVAKIKTWCEENAGLSREELTIKVLKTADKWADFYAALQTLQQVKDSLLLPIIAKRFNDFNGGFWPSYRGDIAKTMYEMGNQTYIPTVRVWNSDTTDIWVNLWTSMFLLKYDKGGYGTAMKELESILDKCDGTAYYPHAMDLLLSLNDPKALKLAEGILVKPQFQYMMYWDYYLNFIRKLIACKSDYTFNFFSSALDAYTPEEMERSHRDDDHVMAQKDGYVQVVDGLKNGSSQYLQLRTNSARLEYIQSLSKWFKTQYALLKQGKPNELLLEVKEEREPVSFVDTYRQ